MITPSQARLKEKEQFLEEYDRSRSRSAKRKITTPLQARLKEKEQFLEDYDYDRSRSRSAKRKIKKVTRQSETKKNIRTLEETCAAKKGYELIDMNDGSKSCRKKCKDSKPVRSSSKGRKCIQGIVRVATSSSSIKKRIRKNRRENDSFLADEDDILTSEQIADKDAAIKKVRQGNRTMKCLGEISTKELEEEIAQRKKEARVYQEQEKEDDLRGKELLAQQAVTDVVVQGKQKKRITPTAVAATIRKE